MAAWTWAGSGQQPATRSAEAAGHGAAGPAVAAAVLAVAAAAQALAQPAARTGTGSGDLDIAFVLLTLCTVLPAWVLSASPAAAAVVVCAACALSLSAFHALTVAGLLVQLAVLYRLGRGGRQLLAAALALVFLCLALVFLAASLGDSGVTVLTVLLAALGRRRPGLERRGVLAARRPSIPPPGRSSPDPCWSTPCAASGPGSPASCMTSSPTTFP